jgi:hypothetical protein
MNVYHTQTGKGKRASGFFKERGSAQAKADEQNAKAEDLGIKTRYEVGERDGSELTADQLKHLS